MTPRLRHSVALMVVAAGLGPWAGCRGRQRVQPQASVSAPLARATSVPTETAALLLVTSDGKVHLRCLPNGSSSNDLFPGQPMVRIFDSVARGGGWVAAALLSQAGGTAAHPNGQLGLLTPGAPVRVLADGPRYARFSAAGTKLLFETSARKHVGGGAIMEVPSSRVLDLASGDVEVIGDYADPRWEADGRHVRATRLTAEVRDRRSHTTAGWKASRVRWDSEAKSLDTEGAGGAQMPAPHGGGVAWTALAPSPFAPLACNLQWGGSTVQQRPAVGPFCQGKVDDRAARWSPDGAWLAFASIARDEADAAPPATELDVWSLSGVRHPAVARLAPPPKHESLRWIDWSASGRYLLAENAARQIWLYDLQEAQATAQGYGSRPQWSPAGAYMLVHDTVDEETADGVTEIRLLPGPGTRATLPALERARDAAWAPASVCAKIGDRGG